MSKKIAILCPEFASGGSVASTALRQARELGKEYSVTLYSNSAPAKFTPAIDIRTVTASTYIWLRRFGHVPREIARANAVAKKLLEDHKCEKYSTLISHSHILMAFVIKKIPQLADKCYLVMHGRPQDRPVGMYDPLVHKLYIWAARVVEKSAVRLIVLSQAMKDRLITCGVEERRIAVIPNGINPEDIGLADGGGRRTLNGKGPLKLVYVGRLSLEKGIDVLLEASKLAVRDGVDFNLDIIGEGPLKKKVVSLLVQDKMLNGKIRLLASVPRVQLGNIYRAYHFTVLPSLDDAFPYVALESLLSGTPLIASAVGGLVEIINNDRNGRLVQPDSPQALANAIKEFATHRDLIPSLADNSAGSVWPRYGWENIGHELVELFKSTS